MVRNERAVTTFAPETATLGGKDEVRRDGVSFATDAALKPFFDRLSRHGELSADCRANFLAALSAPRRLKKGACIATEGEVVTALTIVCDGLVLSSRRLPDGLQQHLAVLAPGQVSDQAGYVLARAGVSTYALIEAIVVSVARPALSAVLQTHPELIHSLTREMAMDARVAHEWMVNMGRRSAYARTAHFLCEVLTRLEEVGMARRSVCPFPLTQSDLADALGLSVVHTNRVLQRLRREELIRLTRNRLDIRDWNGLVNACGFNAGYLHSPERD